MNKYQPHVIVIPEDDATRQLADGFVLHHSVKTTRISVVAPAGGWPKVRDLFEQEYVSYLNQYPTAHVVMLIDFDDQYEPRRNAFEDAIPTVLKERVFVVGVKGTPEQSKNALNKSFENIGSDLAKDCDDGITTHWDHEEFRHNSPDRERLLAVVRPFLF